MMLFLIVIINMDFHFPSLSFSTFVLDFYQPLFPTFGYVSVEYFVQIEIAALHWWKKQTNKYLHIT